MTVREIQPPEVWGVATFPLGDRQVAWEAGQDEIRDDAMALAPRWQALGIRKGERALFVTLLSQAAHAWPMQIATLISGAQLSCADATGADAMRVAMFCRTLSFRAVVGVDEACLDGLADIDAAPADVLGDVPVVLAHPGAYRRLESSGLRPYRLLFCGPALGIGVEAGGPALVDAARWTVEADPAGELRVTSLTDRHTPFTDQPTGVRGQVDPAVVDGRECWAIVPEDDPT